MDDEEDVARLLHSSNDQPETARFKREGELQPPKKLAHSDACGDQDGASVVRSSGLSEGEIRTRAETLAKQKTGRASRGALIAQVKELRAIRLEDDPDRQVVFVYDDPLEPQEPRHAVVRVDSSLRADFVDVRGLIMKAFSRSVSP